MAKITKKGIKTHVKENLVPVEVEGRVACGDDRHEKEQSKDAIRIFGGNMGSLMAEFATLKDKNESVTSKELVEAYAEVRQEMYGSNANLDYHCDEKHHEKGEFGCSHIKHAANPENDGKYGSIVADDVRELFEAFSQHQMSKLTILNGEHKAEGVIFLHTPQPEAKFALNSKNKKGKSFFVVDKDRAERYFDEITPRLSQKLGISIKSEDVKRNYWLQVESTTKLLEADKLPNFIVTVNADRDFRMEQLPKPN